MRFEGESVLTYLDKKVETMNTVYNAFEPLYYDIADYMCPTLPQFASTDVNLGDRRSQKIIDSTATLYARVEQAGMMSSITSPSRPWFRLTIRDKEVFENAAVKQWLADVNQHLLTTLVLSNFYTEIMTFYNYAINFGTAALYVEEDLSGKVARFLTLPIGSYRLADDSRGRVDTVCRTMRYTVRQLLEEFAKTTNGEIDWSQFSSRVKDAWENNRDDEVVEVVHIICPNPDWKPGNRMASGKKWWSYYYEKSNARDPEEDRFLKKSGYDYFPFLVFRWNRNPGDTYATDCPGITALSDVKQLQSMEERKHNALEKMTDPPMVAPSSLEQASVNLMPGGITYADGDNTTSLRPLMEVKLDIVALEASMTRVRDRIARAFSADLFRTLSQLDEVQTGKMTATEARIRQQEGMRQLGPTLEELNDYVFAPLIDIVFQFCVRQNVLPEAPEELRGRDLKIEYISIMAQAQQLESLSGIERLWSFAKDVATVDQQILDVINTDFLVREEARILSLPPNSTNPEDETNALRQKRSAMVEAQQKAATLQQASQGMVSLAGVPGRAQGGGSMLDEQMQRLQAAGIQTGGGE